VDTAGAAAGRRKRRIAMVAAPVVVVIVGLGLVELLAESPFTLRASQKLKGIENKQCGSSATET
jgi:hypothetical protein